MFAREAGAQLEESEEPEVLECPTSVVCGGAVEKYFRTFRAFCSKHNFEKSLQSSKNERNMCRRALSFRGLTLHVHVETTAVAR